ncbi:MAG TPA: glycosyltransferase family 1 protein [Pyrinomonadaceae bacterium]
MHIGIDGLPLTAPKTGVGHYTFELARALAEADLESEFELVYPSTFPPIRLDTNRGEGRPPGNLKLKRAMVGPLARHWWSNGLPRYVRRNEIQLFHGTNYDVPLWRRCATVLTIHDLSPLLYPETHRKRSVRRTRRRLPLMARTADAIITPTQSVRREVCEHLAVKAEKVFAIPEAARASFRPTDFAATKDVRCKLGCGDEFLLAVGTIEPRKNLSVLVTAFEQLTRARPQSKLKLVIAGGLGWLNDSFFETIKRSPARDRIVVTDYLHDEELRALYGSCRAFIYPSLYEGFGLPPLEAMACGAPVVASRIPALVEIAGVAASFFDPTNAIDLAKTILALLEDENARNQLSLAGQNRAAEFTWQKAAQATLDVYSMALKDFSARR